ncbi:methionine--tRNA ligase [Candidatus Woesebacteria bacterium]|nr:methionine--tRNA ligase [Candidatus Woesebacteria bacterium]
MKKYITTAIPYVNGAPHIGHAFEFVQADFIKRYYKDIAGEDVLLLSGADENALKNVRAAETAGEDVQRFVDKHAIEFHELAKKLNVIFDVFQKGSDKKHHFPASQELWTRCAQNGDIYQTVYEGLYCVGCELFYNKDELDENGECFEHPGKPLEMVKEENYYFRLSRYHQKIIDLISSDTIKVLPEERKHEVMAFLKQPLQDISISRTNERAKNWGVPVPEDDSQRMYVWFDALNIYQSGVGFGWNKTMYEKWWPADIHVIGKGITRFHAVYWPAFLLSAGLKLPKTIFVHGYFTVDGQKMSKTLGNVIDPMEIVKKFGTDALRFFFAREMPSTADGDFSFKRMEQLYNSELANELGNLVSRITTMAAIDGITITITQEMERFPLELSNLYVTYQFQKVVEYIWTAIRDLNKEINKIEPWNFEAKRREKYLTQWLIEIHKIGKYLIPIMPDTAKAIMGATKGRIDKVAPLFPRLSK